MKKLFTRKTVASVMAGFQKVVDDLYQVAEQHTQAAAQAGDEIDLLLDKVEAKEEEMAKAQAEAQSATMLAEKIQAQFHLN